MSLSIDTTYNSPNFTERRNGFTKPTMVVMHYTACPLQDAIYTLTLPESRTTNPVSAHYLIPENNGENRVYELVEPIKRAWHAGLAYFNGIEDINSASIGIEHVNWGYTYGIVPPEPSHPFLKDIWSRFIHLERRIGDQLQNSWIAPQKTWHDFDVKQIDTSIQLCKKIIKDWKIDPDNFVGHEEVAVDKNKQLGRKEDPNCRFPWKTFAEKGIGPWPQDSIKTETLDLSQGTSSSWMQQKLKDWGYSIPSSTGHMDPPTEAAYKVFCNHFCVEEYREGAEEPTRGSMEILANLLQQRENKKK